MHRQAKLPIGIDSFEKIRKDGFYYVDKTGLIVELLDNWGEVNLFTRPRRFGKSLNMSMLRYFFEYGCDSSLFDGLEVARARELCDEFMGKFPVISVSLKGVSGRTYEEALGMLRTVIGNEAMRFSFLQDSHELTVTEKERYQGIVDVENGRFTMSEEVLANSLQTLCGLLCRHYGRQVILLIDEYDVPLEKAQQNGFYDEIVNMIRNLFGQALKTNASLKFAVLTGCLRISKESIFTGLNNLKVLSVTNLQFDEHFGFTDSEVKKVLADYGLENRYDLVKKWYDGYEFGNAEVYCPWDVVNYVDSARVDPEAEPQAFWMNTSTNSILRALLQKATAETAGEVERLINGESIRKKIREELTYKELYDSIDNLWSVLFTTGYLTKRGRSAGGVYQLKIPNLEVRYLFVEQIQNWFDVTVRQDVPKLDEFCDAFQKADVAKIEDQLNSYLSRTIGIHDYSVRRDLQENYYHGLLVGLLRHREDWRLTSNEESGVGYSDILIEVYDRSLGIVIEIKYAEDGDLARGCEDALRQIESKQYESRLIHDGMENLIKYGIAFWRKRCRVQIADDCIIHTKQKRK